jgi:hypothetical protein
LTHFLQLTNGDSPFPDGLILSVLGNSTGKFLSRNAFPFSSYKIGIGSPQNL